VVVNRGLQDAIKATIWAVKNALPDDLDEKLYGHWETRSFKMSLQFPPHRQLDLGDRAMLLDFGNFHFDFKEINNPDNRGKNVVVTCTDIICSVMVGNAMTEVIQGHSGDSLPCMSIEHTVAPILNKKKWVAVADKLLTRNITLILHREGAREFFDRASFMLRVRRYFKCYFATEIIFLRALSFIQPKLEQRVRRQFPLLFDLPNTPLDAPPGTPLFQEVSTITFTAPHLVLRIPESKRPVILNLEKVVMNYSGEADDSFYTLVWNKRL
jgi:hypothetical protein